MTNFRFQNDLIWSNNGQKMATMAENGKNDQKWQNLDFKMALFANFRPKKLLANRKFHG